MPAFQVGDIVRVEMPRGYSMRGVLGISLMFTTHPEARFEGAIGTITEINPVGPHSVAQYLVDFRTHDNGRVGIPWQAQWFREEWLALKERPENVAPAVSAQSAAESTWPERPTASTPAGGGIAHPEAKIFTEGRKDFAPADLDPSQATGVVPDSAYGITPGAADLAQPAETSTAFTGATRADDRSAADVPAYEPTPETMTTPVEATTPSSAPGTMGDTTEPSTSELIIERGDGFVRIQGMSDCPDGYPIKGNPNSGIFHAPTDSSYGRTMPEICFASEDVAIANGYRATERRG
jgi:hypothetical protein